MSDAPVQIHVVADSTGETAARLSRAAQAQFPGTEFTIVRHPRVSTPETLFTVFDALRALDGRPAVVLFTFVHPDLRDLLTRACDDLSVPYADLLGPTLAAFEQAAGHEADRVIRRPVGVEADYFVRISAMEFAIRGDDGQLPDILSEADICLVGASRSGKTPLSIYLGYLGYRAVNVPLVPGIAPPDELFQIDRWRIVGLTIDAERLLAIRSRRVSEMGMSHGKDGYAKLAAIYDELDEVRAVQRQLGCPVVDTTGLALEEAAVRVIDLVDDRARAVGMRLRRPAGSIEIQP